MKFLSVVSPPSIYHSSTLTYRKFVNFIFQEVVLVNYALWDQSDCNIVELIF